MYDDSIKLIEMPELDSISVCMYVEEGDLLGLGERINARCEPAYMNGNNWDVLIRFYLARIDPALMKQVQTDPEAGMFSAYIRGRNPANLATMRRFESHVRAMLADEGRLMEFIKRHADEIEWD